MPETILHTNCARRPERFQRSKAALRAAEAVRHPIQSFFTGQPSVCWGQP